MLVSTFEFLVKPQLPKELQQPPFDKISRTVIQGYFLTLANTTDSIVRVSLVVLQKLFKNSAFLPISSRSRSNSKNLRYEFYLS